MLPDHRTKESSQLLSNQLLENIETFHAWDSLLDAIPALLENENQIISELDGVATALDLKRIIQYFAGDEDTSNALSNLLEISKSKNGNPLPEGAVTYEKFRNLVISLVIKKKDETDVIGLIFTILNSPIHNFEDEIYKIIS